MDTMVVRLNELPQVLFPLFGEKVLLVQDGARVVLSAEESEKEKQMQAIEKLHGLYQSDGHAVERFLAEKHAAGDRW
ncbi:hypothetical protein FACS1894217_03140 [Clostridia bacterium]|nr:hypothetical protein FACS1894217_03140 [Clostridia bacterium]